MDTQPMTMVERNQKIVEMAKSGKSQRAIGKEMHLTGARVNQILKRETHGRAETPKEL
jgi:hypothetical protein